MDYFQQNYKFLQHKSSVSTTRAVSLPVRSGAVTKLSEQLDGGLGQGSWVRDPEDGVSRQFATRSSKPNEMSKMRLLAIWIDQR